MKKKIISITLTIAILAMSCSSLLSFTGLATESLAPSNSKIKVMVNPETRPGNNGYNIKDTSGNFIGGDSSTANGVNDSPAYPFPKYNADQATSMVYPDISGTNWTGAEYFQFYVNNVSQIATDFHWITIKSYDVFGDFAALQFNGGSAYYLYDIAQNIFVPFIGGDLGSITIPANYKGIVKIPVASLTAANWSTTAEDEILNKTVMDRVYSIQFYSNQSNMGVNDILYFDELAVVGSTISSAQTEAQYIDSAFSIINPLVPGNMTISERMDPDFQTVGGVQRAVRADYKGYADTIAFKTVYETGLDINRTDTNFYPMYSNTDFSNAEYLQFYVNNDSTNQGGIYWMTLHAYDALGKFAPLQIINGSVYYQYSQSTGAYVTKNVSGDGGMIIPANYKGFIKIPLSSFADAGWGSTTDQNVKTGKDLSRVYRIQMYINQSVYTSNQALYIDAFSVLGTQVNGYYGEKETEAEYLSDYYSKTAEVIYDPTIPSNDVTVRVVDDIADDVSVTPVNGIGGMKIISQTTNFQRIYMPGVENANWANAEYMQFYVNNVSNEPYILWAFGISIGSYSIGDCTVYLAAQGQPYYLYNKETNTYIEKALGNEGASAAHGSINIPANYKGIIKIPISAFVAQNYPTAGKTDWGKALSVDFYTDGNGKTLYLDHIAVVEKSTGVGEALYLNNNANAFFDGGVIADPTIPSTDYNVRVANVIEDSSNSNPIDNFGGYEIVGATSLQKWFYNPGVENATWTNADYIMYYVNNVNSTPYVLWGVGALIGSFNPGECQDHYLLPGDTYYLYDKISGQYTQKTCGTEGSSTAHGSITIPAYYNGFVKIPKASFSTVTDQSKWDITLAFGTCADSNGRSLFIDKIALLEKTQVTVSEAAYVNTLPLIRLEMLGTSTVQFNATREHLYGISKITTVEEIKANFANPELISITKGETTLGNSDIVGTGCIVKLIVDSQTRDTLSIIIKGDVNGNGVINLDDLVLIRDNLLENKQLMGDFNLAGDLYGEHSITLNSLVGIMSYISESGTINQNI